MFQYCNWEGTLIMKKILLSSLLLSSSLLFINNEALAANIPVESVKSIEGTENIDYENMIYYDTDTQDILITDDVIIRTVEPSEFSTFSAGNGVWDFIGSQTVKAESSVFYSYGGDFKVEVDQTDFGPVIYQLKEKDPYFNDNVGSPITVSGSKTVSLEYRDITSYIDDDDEPGFAEFFMAKLTHKTKGFVMRFYD